MWSEAVAGRLPGSPAPLKHALAARRTSAPLTALQHLVDHLRAREQRESAAERREEWRALRGAVHQALAARNSRLALYDLRDSLLDPDRLPVTFLAALEEIGDATCLETLAAAYEASSRSGDAWWREHVATAFRAIVGREGLTRRHAAVKRMMARWPEAAADLMARIERDQRFLGGAGQGAQPVTGSGGRCGLRSAVARNSWTARSHLPASLSASENSRCATQERGAARLHPIISSGSLQVRARIDVRTTSPARTAVATILGARRAASSGARPANTASSSPIDGR